MAFERVLFKTWTENILFSVMVELTYRCNLDCFFCYNDVGLPGTPLGTEQYFRLFEDLRRMEVMNLILTGGEPLAHPDFFSLGGKARELGFLLRIKSNGHGLRGRVARRLKEEVDPFAVDLSLHGAKAATHDRQTRVPGSFDRLMENIPQLLALGLRLKLNCTLTCWNEGEIDGLFEIADSFGVPISINPIVAPRDDGDREPLGITASRDSKRRLFEKLSERAAVQGGDPASELGGLDEGLQPQEAVEKNCGAGSSGLTIDPYGNVLPCVQWRRPVGNLHDASIREIWERSTGLETIRDLTVEAKRRMELHGPWAKLLGFCPGLAELETGDPLSLYPSAQEQKELLEEVGRQEARRALLPIVD